MLKSLRLITDFKLFLCISSHLFISFFSPEVISYFFFFLMWENRWKTHCFQKEKAVTVLGVPGKHPLGRSCTLGLRPCLDAFCLLNKPVGRIADLRTGITHSSCNGPLLCSVWDELHETTDMSTWKEVYQSIFTSNLKWKEKLKSSSQTQWAKSVVLVLWCCIHQTGWGTCLKQQITAGKLLE